jgi:hypothetical protein
MISENLASLLWELEQRLLQPDVRGSPDVVGDFLDDEFVEFGSSGRVYDKAEIISALAKEQDQEPDGQISARDFRLRMLSDEVALITYRTDRDSRDRRFSSLRSSIWKNQNGRWRMVFHQGTPASQPE